MSQADETTFEDYYLLPPSKYEEHKINSYDFSVRTYRRLIFGRIYTIADLLRSTPASLLGIKGFGKACYDEIRMFCETLKSDTSSLIGSEETYPEKYEKSKVITDNIESIVFGDFSFAESSDISLEEKKRISLYENAFSVLGVELAFDCVSAPEKIIPIISSLNDYCERIKYNIEICQLSHKVPNQRKVNKAIGYIKAFTTNTKEREILMSFCESKDSTISSMFNCNLTTNDVSFVLLKKFVKWCAFDLNAEISELLGRIYKDEKSRLIIRLRSEKHTLQHIGEFLNITRERVRQIEAKLIREFISLHREVRVISKISAELNGDIILSPEKIEMYCGDKTAELLYFLKNYPGVNYTYDKQFDVFIVGDKFISEKILTYIETLPKIIVSSKVKEYFIRAQEDGNFPIELFERAFFNIYQLTGNVYHRNKLLLKDVYQEVLKTYFTNGIRIYDSSVLSKFRNIVLKEYGDIGVPEGDRALGARIVSLCTLRGRGVYILKKKEYISKVLSDKIYNYILNSNETIFMTNTIFDVFYDELMSEGIDNKYYMQGILRELYDDKLFFRRDYISKDPNISSLYSSIIQFISQSNHPVSKEAIYKVFPGISEIVISIAVSDSEILNYFGEYLHCSKLNIYKREVQYLDNVINKFVVDRGSYHIKDIYEVINREKPEILTRNAALFPFSAFSILEYLFRNKYQFSRPYIAQNGVEIGRAAERLHEFVFSNDELNIIDLRSLSKEYRYQIYSTIDYLNDCNDKFLIADSQKIVSIDKIGINEEKAKLVEQILLNVVTETIPIKNLSIWSELPILNLPWTDWLLYSVIKKWGRKLIVSTSSNHFRVAVPLIAPCDNFNEYAYQDITNDSTSSVYIADDLSDLDLLIEDVISEDFLDDL